MSIDIERLALIAEQRETGWPDFHPEDFCHRCGRPNIVWSVDSDRFNVAMAAMGLTSGAIVCPSCFIEGHELATGLSACWELRPRTSFQRKDSE